MDHSLRSLLDVSSTMLITLYARAHESRSAAPIIKDDKAVAMIETIKKEIVGSPNPIHKMISEERYNRKLAVSMALRCRRFDRYVMDFMRKNPRGTVINLGCGLDTRFDRIDNGSIRWFDIDFPEVIELRRRFMAESDRRRFLADSILNRGWVDAARTGGPYLVLAEGVFMYLREKDVRGLLATLHSELGAAELVCEVTNSYWVDKMRSGYMRWKFKHQLGMTGGAVFTFGVPDARYFERWDPAYRFIDEWTYFDDNEKKMGWFNLLSRIEVVRKVQWTIHYRI